MHIQPKLVVFDWAGTVVDFGCFGPVNAFVEGFAALDVAVTSDEARQPMGLAKKEHIRTMLTYPRIQDKWVEIHGRSSTEDDVEAIYRVVTPKQIEAAGQRGEPLVGVLQCTEELRSKGIKIGGTTGYFREAAIAASKTAKEFGYAPDCNVCADDVPAGRPAPWMLFRVMEALGIYPATQVVKVGDTVADIGEGRNAGAFTIAVVDSSNAMGLSLKDIQQLSRENLAAKRVSIAEKFLAAGAHAVIEDLSQLNPTIELLYPQWVQNHTALAFGKTVFGAKG